MLKQLCVSLAVLAVASAATAADITNPFYLPTKGQVGSITSVGFDKTQQKNKDYNSKYYTTEVREELQYGITDTLTLAASLGNSFFKEKDASGENYKKDENMNWDVTLAWNIFNKDFKLQAAATYLQDKLYNNNGEYKSVYGEVKMGYQFAQLLPYILVAEELPIAQSKGYDKPVYHAKLGLYQGKTENWGLDTGIRWIHNVDDGSSKQTVCNAEVEASYYLTKNGAVSVYGTYALDGKAKNNADVYEKSIGLRLRWFF